MYVFSNLNSLLIALLCGLHYLINLLCSFLITRHSSLH
nr:MAG TPA: hypothetical protein [Bacteriophage sp.]